MSCLGDAHCLAHDLRAAGAAWGRAAAILDQLGHPDVEHLHAKLSACAGAIAASDGRSLPAGV